jgi:histidine triad (HIT) family protein
MDCIFCKIVAGEIPAKRLFEDGNCVAFADVNPQAPVHLLVVPRQHIASLAAVAEEQTTLAGHLLVVAAKVAKQHGLANGFRIVINTGDDGGQTVHHLHVHVLGGRQMHWPPG